MRSSEHDVARPDRSLGVLVVGVGTRGSERAAAAALGHRLRLVAVHDRDSEAAERVAARHGVVAVRDLDAGLESRGVDVVVVATPPADHAGLVADALDAGKHVLCETPLALRGRDARALARRAARAQLRLAAAFPERFEPPVRDAARLVESWAIGRVESVRVEVGRRASLPFLQSWHTEVGRSGGGCLVDHGPLACDLIRRFVGEVVLAKGFVRQEVRLPHGCESEAFGLFRNHDNAYAELHASWNLPAAGTTIAVRGEGGHLTVGLDPWRLSGRLGDGRVLDRRYRRARAAERWHRARHGCPSSIAAELDAFGGPGAAGEFPGWDGAATTEMIRALLQSDRTGEEVHLNPPLVATTCRVGP